MKIYSKKTVYDAALDRIRFLFDEFPNIVVGFSGGKDSTICLELSLIVAKEKNRLPLRVLWIDQEAEWQSTVDYAKSVMYRDEVHPMWFQIPMVITNNASNDERYSYCWKEGDDEKWIHPKDPIAIHENKYDVFRFHEAFQKIFEVDFKDEKSCYISGVRAEENPKRFVALQGGITYKWITWGKKLNQKMHHFTFYPLYDWSYTDVWKSIHDNNWKYNKLYDKLYQFGVDAKSMRVSNVHHETAIRDLKRIQEIEPETWLKVQRRIPGANTIKHLKDNSFVCPRELPHMFDSWEEYFIHLADNLVHDPANRKTLQEKHDANAKYYQDDRIKIEFYKTMINTILSADWDYTKLRNWIMRPPIYSYKKWLTGKTPRGEYGVTLTNPYLSSSEKQKIINLYEGKD